MSEEHCRCMACGYEGPPSHDDALDVFYCPRCESEDLQFADEEEDAA